MGIKSDEFLKSTKATCAKYRKYMKICFKMNKIIDFNLRCKFQSIWTCLGNIIRKTENKFPSPLFLILCLSSHYGISNILLHHKNFSPRNHEISVTWFLLKSLLKTEMQTQGCQDKRKQMETMLLRYQPSVTCNPRTALKSTLDFTEIVKEWKSKRGTVCHISDLFPNCHKDYTLNSYAVQLGITMKTIRWKILWPKNFG